MARIFLVLLAVFPVFAFGETLKEEELIGKWIPSGEMPREDEVANYTLLIRPDFNATYIAVDKDFKLSCNYMPSDSQSSVFVWYCYLNDKHLITLSLAGWRLDSGFSLLYGYEYWLGDPAPGEIYGGLPVSLKLENL